MGVSNTERMALPPDKLNDLDKAILDYLREEERATPNLLQKELQARDVSTGVRQNVNSRMVRLAEHGHLENVRETGVYAFVSDPRANE